MVIPVVEIRKAKQEDHDDLAIIFESKSEVATDAYGEFFLAELIESQDEQNKAIVAQIGDKARGLLALSSEVDISVL